MHKTDFHVVLLTISFTLAFSLSLSRVLIPISITRLSSFVIYPYHYDSTIVAQHVWCQE